jgi:hypothetical protein
MNTQFNWNRKLSPQELELRKRRGNRLGLGLLLFFAAIFIYFILGTSPKMKDCRKLKVERDSVVGVVYQRSFSRAGESVTVHFSINEDIYGIPVIRNKNFYSVGDSVTVYYLPSDPYVALTRGDYYQLMKEDSEN